MMLNPFKRSKKTDDTQKLGMLQRVAMKKAMNMNSKERNKIVAEAMKPENRDKLLKTIAMMEKSGMVSSEQIEQAKKQLGI